MTYQDALATLSRFNKLGIRLGLDPIRSLLARLGNPQEDYRTVLVAGTNGKGSVAAMTASMLSAGGFRTGLYTSPDLVDIRERIRIDGRMIGTDEFASGVQEIQKKLTEEISYFEFLTALAFLHFHREQVDIAILEIGMGGRLDATNVVTPLASVITNISLDHQAYLGDTLEAIAREKGGIIKAGVPCLTAAVQEPAVETLRRLCNQRGARLFRLGKEIRLRTHRDGSFSYQGIGRRFERLTCPLAGRHQLRNAALALGTIELIGEAPGGLKVDDGAVAEGLGRTRWEGRLEVLQRNPLLLVDGAHNQAGAATLRRALLADFSYRHLWLIFGVLGDKDYGAMVKRLFPLAQKVILTHPGSERALPLETLLATARRYQRNVEIIEDPACALQSACLRVGKEDLICVAGSLYLVGAIKKIMGSRRGSEGAA
ncbi:MAG: bifunctional folylpolyglutamate synthase/dihydrofolate synthase [Deltaproteobacteria bacterium]|nr:bifunctional folylpolyglutamate synthase/dihydrofolate synthase [Deltaproteobacteria bacterium]